tara:strand:+ start:567 stop:827 length:261 start_codon:yes stop_codon:yes gene_type:complete
MNNAMLQQIKAVVISSTKKWAPRSCCAKPRMKPTRDEKTADTLARPGRVLHQKKYSPIHAKPILECPDGKHRPELKELSFNDHKLK